MSKPRKLTHVDAAGNSRMVDVGEKPETARSATASAEVHLSRDAFVALTTGTAAKGDVIAVARIAGIQAAKRTSEWIPLCHPVPLTSVQVDFETDAGRFAVEITATARCVGRTGVEMEALTAVSAAALTVYDMLKAVDRGIRIEGIRLRKKTGGKSGEYTAT